MPVTPRAFLLTFARHFRSLGGTVDAMASGVKSGPECLEAFNCVHDVSWSRSVLEIGRLVKSVAEIEQVVADGSYDIVHVHTPIAGAVTRFALRHLRRRCRTKVVYTAHGFHFHPLGGVVRNAVTGRFKTSHLWAIQNQPV